MDSETLQLIEECGYAQFSVVQTLKIAGIKGFTFNHEEQHEAYERGQLKAELEVRKAVMESAKAGSTPAQTLAWEMIKQTHMHNA